MNYSIIKYTVALGDLVVSMLAGGHKIYSFKPGQAQWIFNPL
jgi:hypothetical protein